MPKVGGLSATEWMHKANRAERRVMELKRQIEYRDTVLKEADRKLKDIRRVNRELVKAQRDKR
tara:strand:- start:9254 stop:9442 length:189 start_codon:yes stop_codon:yes gene_type:complete